MLESSFWWRISNRVPKYWNSCANMETICSQFASSDSISTSMCRKNDVKWHDFSLAPAIVTTQRCFCLSSRLKSEGRLGSKHWHPFPGCWIPRVEESLDSNIFKLSHEMIFFLFKWLWKWETIVQTKTYSEMFWDLVLARIWRKG